MAILLLVALEAVVDVTGAAVTGTVVTGAVATGAVGAGAITAGCAERHPPE